ncbi:hypothetical protein AB0M28_15685 [Streptomyces sp. NPDC051940]|uniref:hypothetical protein n=1 Tax=Streptomyces sp. NPDC051940 TaxID=3155675 RepID=UPI00343D019E
MRPQHASHSLRRRARILTAAAALALGGAAITAAPAAAAGPNCANGNHCVFYTDIYSPKHSFFNSDHNFNDDFFLEGPSNQEGSGQIVDNNVWSASNSSTGGYESHYYDTYGGTYLFCVNPGHYANSHSWDDAETSARPNGGPLPDSLRQRASALVLRGTTTKDCY